MWVKRHWAGLVGVIPMLPILWRGIVHFLDWGSRIDLITTKWHEAGGVSGILAFFINPPAWLIWPALVVGLGLIWWDVRRKPRTITANVSVAHDEPTYDPPSMPSEAPMSPPMVVPPPEAIARVQNELARAAAKMPHSQEPPNLQVLFDKNDTGFIKLKFLPDTQHKEEDALLLIVYGYRVLGNRHDISVSLASKSLSASGAIFKGPRNIAEQLAGLMLRQVVDADELVRTCVNHSTLRKTKLAQGGYVEITDEGMLAAGALADDLIRRA